MRSYIKKPTLALAFVAAMAAPACRTVDEAAQAKAAATGVPKADPDALAFVAGPSAQVMFDAFDVSAKTTNGVSVKTFEGVLVVSCSRSGKDVFFCAMSQRGSNKVVFALDKEPALDFYASFKIAEKTLGPISTKTYDGYGQVKCQYTVAEAGRQGFYCDLTGDEAIGPVAELKGSGASELYKALKLPEVTAGSGKDKEKGTTASIYIRCAKYSGNKFHCLLKTGSTSLAVVKGPAASALYESLRTPERQQGAKVLKEFQGTAKIECRADDCAVGFARAESKPARKKP